MKGVVVNHALGRVTVIHENGRASTISSPDPPFAISQRQSPLPSRLRRAPSSPPSGAREGEGLGCAGEVNYRAFTRARYACSSGSV